MTAEYYKEQLASKEEMLAQTTRFLVSTQKLLEEKNRDLAAINQNIFESINFAALIQKSLLPDSNILKVFFKDAAYRVMQQIGIGGDNVFVKNTNDGVMFGLLDSTGHGIPAALLSISGTVILKELIYAMEINNPKALLQLLNQQMHTLFNQHDRYKLAQKDGIIFNYLASRNTLTYCSARGKALHLRGDGLVQPLEFTRRSVGEDPDTVFTQFEITVSPGDKLLIYSDGLQDQFGGNDYKKFSAQRLKDLLLAGSQTSATQLAVQLEEAFKTWKGTHSQTDDVSFILIDF